MKILKRTITPAIILTAAISAGSYAGSTKVAAMANDDLDGATELHQVPETFTTRAGISGDVQQRQELREDFQQTYPLAADGRVSLENLNGGVRISVWDRNEVQVNAVKRAYRRDRLNEATIQVSSTPEVIRIETEYPHHDMNFTNEEKGRYNNPATVEYTLTVPRRARLESIDLVNGSVDIDGVEGDVNASTVNGALSVRGLKGEAKLNTVNGELQAVFAHLDPAKTFSLGSVNGNVVMTIPSDANAIVRAETISGDISNDFGLATEDGEYVGHSLYGQIGSGGPRIKLGNVSGGINVKHAQDGRTLSGSTNLLSQKEQEKQKFNYKYKEKHVYSEEQLKKLTEDSRRIADEVRKGIDVEKLKKEIAPEVQRETQRALRDAQREIQRAQREVQRENERQIREQLRSEARGEGRGEGRGAGKGLGVIEDRRFSLHESKSFPVTGMANINLSTYDGNIVVHGWDKAEVKYTATMSGRDETEARTVRIETEQRGSEVSIIARSDEMHQGSASLEVFVPRNSSVHVSSDDGSLSLQGVTGELTLRTDDGNVEVSDSKGQLTANTGDGSIEITKFDGQVEARTGDGPISLDGSFTGLKARTGDGPISLSVAQDSNFTLETNTEEISNEGMPISEDIAPTKRAKRWKVGRGGSIFVLGTGDGTILLRAR
jgi:DUF4097 and DUF4098 domain-containing protein YvlB